MKMLMHNTNNTFLCTLNSLGLSPNCPRSVNILPCMGKQGPVPTVCMEL